MLKKTLAVLAGGAWIGLNEFIRNELLFKSYWIEKYRSLNLEFPSGLVNNAIWGIWSILLAVILVYMAGRLRFLETLLLTWVMGFVLMWLVIGNLNILPYTLLYFAVPWSILETAGAVWISRLIVLEKK